jgi:hypothetical protein
VRGVSAQSPRVQPTIFQCPNATSYGIFIELNVENADDEDALVSIFTSQGKRTVSGSERELPGRYYRPLLATLITGAARLMLALTERPAFEHGLNWAFCDTESMAFANMKKLSFDEFVDSVQKVCAWFVPLNPYEPDPKKGAVSILEMENQNFSKEREKRTSLNLSTALRSQRSAMRSSIERSRGNQSSGRPRPMALATTLLPTATKRKAATSEAAA